MQEVISTSYQTDIVRQLNVNTKAGQSLFNKSLSNCTVEIVIIHNTIPTIYSGTIPPKKLDTV
jgi:hypothetical protein